MRYANKERTAFIKLFYALSPHHSNHKELFEMLNLKEEQAHGRKLFKDYHAFKCSRNWYLRDGSLGPAKPLKVLRPNEHDLHLVCPQCQSRLVFH